MAIQRYNIISGDNGRLNIYLLWDDRQNRARSVEYSNTSPTWDYEVTFRIPSTGQSATFLIPFTDPAETRNLPGSLQIHPDDLGIGFITVARI